MASPVFIGSIAFVAGYLAMNRHEKKTEASETAGSNPANAPNVGENKLESAAQADAAASDPGKYQTPTGLRDVDGHGFVPPDFKNSSCSPSGGVVGGSTSVTPSGGPSEIPGIGSTLVEVDGSPTGPITSPPPPNAIDATKLTAVIKFGSLSGLTAKQESAALAEEGPAQGMVW